MFISVLDLFKVGIGPSSSHTMGPMVAARDFLLRLRQHHHAGASPLLLRCTLKGSLSATGKGHATDSAIVLGLNGYLPEDLVDVDVGERVAQLREQTHLYDGQEVLAEFSPQRDIVFDAGPPLPQHPNGMIFEACDDSGQPVLAETFFSIGGGFVSRCDEHGELLAPEQLQAVDAVPYPFDSAASMLEMARETGLSIAAMKQGNEQARLSSSDLDTGLEKIWQAMRRCLEQGLAAEGILPGGIDIPRRAKSLYQRLLAAPQQADVSDWLCAYAMAVNEENADGHMVVTAPTNGAAGVIPAVLYHFVTHHNGDHAQVREFLLTASAIGGLIKHRSSISGAEVGCQGEVGSASAMAAAGLCAIRGGSPSQVEHAAEIALEHHLGMTCDPVHGLVQVPCIERNGFGAVKAYTAASLALHGSGQHFMSLDQCIAAMKQTGEEMSVKFKETSLGGLAVAITEC